MKSHGARISDSANNTRIKKKAVPSSNGPVSLDGLASYTHPESGCTYWHLPGPRLSVVAQADEEWSNRQKRLGGFTSKHLVINQERNS